MFKNWPFKNKCEDIGELLYCEYKKEEKRGEGCGNLMLDWIENEMWANVVYDHVPIFYKVYDILLLNGNITNKNKYIYGDIDVGLWIEKTNKDKKVIASTRYCSCADDNTHIFILRDKNYGYNNRYINFICKTVWPRSQRNSGWNFGDYRDIKIPSIKTYRKYNFNFGCNDGRDKGYVFNFNYCPTLGMDLKDSRWVCGKISHALQQLRWHLEALENYHENKC